ncbi:hypothetical protein C1J01_43560 [Nonomuraea aridisoli]|uniref:Nitrite/Sulfite reductase ferredoxin-like domain-containing protein n=2 Tax=Nonomuraea aridisoli TaxID=2070368 RepID=A0A2W2D3K7_9ACTN|nr:hypothetical protein C1J01_43560 [Nonomuraea aridisoli]
MLAAAEAFLDERADQPLPNRTTTGGNPHQAGQATSGPNPGRESGDVRAIAPHEDTRQAAGDGDAGQVATDPVLGRAASDGGSVQREHGAWRLAELPDGAARIAARLGLTATQPPARTTAREHSSAVQSSGAAQATEVLSAAPASPGGLRFSGKTRAGVVRQRDGRVALEVVVPLGRLSSAQAEAIAAQGAPVRLTPWRSVVLLDLAPEAADRAAEALGAAGLVTDAASPWVGVSACTGRPGCAKSRADVQEDARRWVATLDAPPPTPVHWAGCERRCGLPRGQVVQMVATGDGYEERHP